KATPNSLWGGSVFDANPGSGFGANQQVANFHVLTGASKGISAALLCLVPVSAAIGWIVANRLGIRDPVRFSSLGQDRL
ncbi:hypothetical protein DEE71_11075, partial [Ralstonia insidiosa]|nr:hypothetical protein [Ralstonia insidiosa]MBX3835285.1 hypothetical protein [Ralstonia insidiosa]MBX3895841.1 hypothetical protein [Ralstonia insidiosa]MBX3901812.1 hypothetical protein [Ralstonia insidiosa]